MREKMPGSTKKPGLRRAGGETAEKTNCTRLYSHNSYTYNNSHSWS
jgi:hypothetical protein